MKVVIINPTYNEKGNIERLITILQEEIFPGIKNHEMHILVADDSSPDGTAEEVKKLQKKWKNLHLIVGQKQGLGAAYVRAMDYSIKELSADVMFEMDADLSHNPKKIPEFLAKIDEGYDMVIGTRYSNGGSIPPNWPPQRKAFSYFGNLLVRSILMRFSTHDWTGGFRALKKEVFLKEKDELTNFKGYTFQVSFLHKVLRDGFKVAEVPIAFTDRTLGRSKIAPSEYIVDLLKYVIGARIKELEKFFKFLVVGGFGFVINAIVLRVGVQAFKLSPEVSNLIGAAIAIFSNYNFNNIWTFKESAHKGIGLYFWKMIQFYATSAFGVIVIQTGTIALLDKILGTKYYFWYFILGTGILLVWNYTIYNRFIWKTKSSK